MKYSGNTTNMSTHMRRHHPDSHVVIVHVIIHVIVHAFTPDLHRATAAEGSVSEEDGDELPTIPPHHAPRWHLHRQGPAAPQRCGELGLQEDGRSARPTIHPASKNPLERGRNPRAIQRNKDSGPG